MCVVLTYVPVHVQLGTVQYIHTYVLAVKLLIYVCCIYSEECTYVRLQAYCVSLGFESPWQR